ncbi:hypothetical protein OG394_06130 [Kribbella sp. NBC_01245]|uniref:DUF6602 domain-containing protein n=1 Tax=Kribbella sp. NBC_01245 TaxID=2903578 RepID=UPI002E2A9E65|nr:DUF6602 domain-containing protein [Kribbella sp. NBC_01245]
MTSRDERLRAAFLQKQRQLLVALEIVPELTAHGTTIGDDSEANWVRVLREFLPARYGVAAGIVMDADGNMSEQMDVLIYDPQYSPLLAQTSAGDLFVPAEAIYAAFEVKQEMNKTLMDYAGKKVASVRRLRRTSIPIPHAGGMYPAKPPVDIIGGMVTTRNGWSDLEGKAAVQQIMGLPGDRRIDIGCALAAISFDRPDDPEADVPEYSDDETTLLFFLFRLFRRLQRLGTVAAIDISSYTNRLDLSAEPLSSDELTPESLNLEPKLGDA